MVILFGVKCNHTLRRNFRAHNFFFFTEVSRIEPMNHDNAAHCFTEIGSHNGNRSFATGKPLACLRHHEDK